MLIKYEKGGHWGGHGEGHGRSLWGGLNLILFNWVQSIRIPDYSWICYFSWKFNMLFDNIFAQCLLFGVFAHWFWLNGFINCAYYSTPHTELLHNTTNVTTPLLASVRAIHRFTWLASHSRSRDQSKIVTFNFDLLDIGIAIEQWTFFF